MVKIVLYMNILMSTKQDKLFVPIHNKLKKILTKKNGIKSRK